MKKRWVCIAAAVLIVLAASICVYMEASTRLYVLMYHSVAPDGTECGEWTVTQSTFRAHMNWLTEHGYTSVLPSELVSGERLPDKPVLITFDDGYADNCTLALPVLRETGHKATISIVTGYTDVIPMFMTWDQCRELESSGLVELGCHTHNLHDYPGLSRLEGETREEFEARAFSDLEYSIALMEENLGRRPLVIAYPHGMVDEWAEDYVNRNFPITLIGVGRVNHTLTGLRDLRRCNLNELYAPSDYLSE